MKSKIKIIAHRGFSAKYPENTLLAFGEAVKEKADAIEYDLHETKDGQVVVHHDYYIKLGKNRVELINNLKLLELKKHFDQIPSLKEVVSAFGRKVDFELELKTPRKEFVEKTLKILNDTDVLDFVEFTSPHVPLLMYLKIRYPDLKTGLLFQPYPVWMESELGRKIVISYMMLTKSDVAHIPLSIVDDELIRMLHYRNKLIHIPNCNGAKTLKEVMKIKGIDQISTTDPVIARKYLRGR